MADLWSLLRHALKTVRLREAGDPTPPTSSGAGSVFPVHALVWPTTPPLPSWGAVAIPPPWVAAAGLKRVARPSCRAAAWRETRAPLAGLQRPGVVSVVGWVADSSRLSKSHRLGGVGTLGGPVVAARFTHRRVCGVAGLFRPGALATPADYGQSSAAAPALLHLPCGS